MPDHKSTHSPTPTPAAGTLARRAAQAHALLEALVAIREMAGRNADYLRAMDADYLLMLIHDRAAAAVSAQIVDAQAEVDELPPPPGYPLDDDCIGDDKRDAPNPADGGDL